MGLLHRYVIDHGQGRRSNADQIVDVHRHAVDANGVVAIGHLGDNGLGANAIGGDGQANAAQVDDAGVVPDVQLYGAGRIALRPGLSDAIDDTLQTLISAIGIDASTLIGGFTF